MAFVHNGFCYMAVLQVRPVIPSESSKFRLGRLVRNISNLQSVFTESVLKEFQNMHRYPENTVLSCIDEQAGGWLFFDVAA